MSVAEQTTFTSKSPRCIPSTVRLVPQVVNDLCTHPRTDKAGADKGQGAIGLLFGTAEQDVLSVQAFKAFPVADSTENGSSERECLDGAFERSLASAKMDQDLAALQLVGWYCIRRPGDIAPLSESDIEFHNRRFRRATDVALLLKPKQHTGASIDLIELYSRSSSKAALSRQDYRSGSLLLTGTADVNAPSDVAMRETVDDDYYLKVFQTLDALDRAERKQDWKRIALWLKPITPLSLRPEWMRTQVAPGVDATAPDDSGLAAKTANRMVPSPGSSTSLPVNSPLPGARWQTRVHWIFPALVIMLAMGVGLAWFYARPLLPGLPGKALFHRAPASTPLNITVEPQAGGSLLVKWDAHYAGAQSAKNGTVQIDDGSEHRDLHLDSNQVANGSILYTPISRDLTFRLEIVGSDGSPISESMRVVNGSKSSLAAHTIPNARPSTLAKTTPTPKEKPDSRQFDTTSHAKATPLAVIGKRPPNVRIRPGPNALGPPVNAQTTPAATSSSAPAPTSGRSGTMAPRVMRPPTRNVLEAERKAPSPRKPQLRKSIQELPPVQPPVSSPQPAVTDNFTSTKYVPPRPLKQVMPSPSNFPASALSRGTDIEVEVRIDDEGRVTEARVVNNISDNTGLFTSAALAAAKEWIFEPAKMHGKSVPSNHVIKFRFHPQVGQQ